MDALNNILLGFSRRPAPINLFLCFIGVVLGTVVAGAPGLGPAATIAIAAYRLTLKLDHTTANHRRLAAFSTELRYGGSRRPYFLNNAWVIVVGCDLSRRLPNGAQRSSLGGRRWVFSANASFVAGTVGVLGLMLISPPWHAFALRFAPPEYSL